MKAAFPPRAPGRKVTGYHPLPGWPRDTEGRLLMAWQYAPERAA